MVEKNQDGKQLIRQGDKYGVDPLQATEDPLDAPPKVKRGDASERKAR